ncbi:MAG: rRNA pseudouridine synthase [Chloroflexota bacterium]|nr:rRNA pseudouridine synthase [Chloroflexota bacterium]
MTERLHKVLAHAGVASRRAAEQMIRARRVRVNGAVVLEMGTQVDPERDAIEVDGRRLANQGPHAQHVYVALNKPLGVVSTASDPERRPTVVEMVDAAVRLYPVGRLDIDSEGLVLLTDDGELTYRLTQARFAVEKEYHVLVDGPDLEDRVLERLRAGVMLEDGLARVVRTNLLRTTPGGGGLVRVVLVEGRKRQVRRMFSALGCVVEGLQRVRIGPLQLGDLEPGEHRRLTAREIKALRSTVGLDYRVVPPSAGGQSGPSGTPTPRGPQSIRSGPR